MSLPQPAQSGREQQPTVTAIPLANSKDGNSSRRRGAARSHYVVTFCFGSLYKIPQDLCSRGKAAARTLLDMGVLHLLALQELGTVWDPASLEAL